MTLDQATDKLYDALQKLGPQAVSLAIDTGRIAAVRTIVFGLVSFMVAAALAKLASVLFKRGSAMKAADKCSDYEFSYVGGVILSVVATVFSITAAYLFFDPFNWVGLIRPDIYLAQRFIP